MASVSMVCEENVIYQFSFPWCYYIREDSPNGFIVISLISISHVRTTKNSLYAVNTGLGTQYYWFGKSEGFAQHNYHAEHTIAKRDWDMPPKKIFKITCSEIESEFIRGSSYISCTYIAIFVYNKYIFSPVLHPGHIFLIQMTC